jgi:hypothetical protein
MINLLRAVKTAPGNAKQDLEESMDALCKLKPNVKRHSSYARSVP